MGPLVQLNLADPVKLPSQLPRIMLSQKRIPEQPAEQTQRRHAVQANFAGTSEDPLPKAASRVKWSGERDSMSTLGLEGKNKKRREERASLCLLRG